MLMLMVALFVTSCSDDNDNDSGQKDVTDLVM